MKLYEHEGKEIFRKNGIMIPQGNIACNLDEAVRISEDVGFPVILKSQILRGGRKKAGGIVVSQNKENFLNDVQGLFSLSIEGENVSHILIEESLNIKKEMYAGITIDYKNSLPLLMFSLRGGIDIENLAQKSPDSIVQKLLFPNRTYHLHDMFELINDAQLDSPLKKGIAQILLNLVQIYFSYDCLTAEINPLCITQEDKLYAADSKIEIDDSALYRIQSVHEFQSRDHELPYLEREAKQKDIAYIALDQGNIGIIAGGAGLGMATMDMISHFGGRPANFLDLGGNATREKTATALNLVLQTPGIQGVLINVFGGINNCADMAQGIADIFDSQKPDQRIVVKMRGHSQEIGWRLLEEREIPLVKYGTTSDAVQILMDTIDQ